MPSHAEDPLLDRVVIGNLFALQCCNQVLRSASELGSNSRFDRPPISCQLWDVYMFGGVTLRTNSFRRENMSFDLSSY